MVGHTVSLPAKCERFLKRLADDHRTPAGQQAGDALADEKDAAVERLADVWWEQLCMESPG